MSVASTVTGAFRRIPGGTSMISQLTSCFLTATLIEHSLTFDPETRQQSWPQRPASPLIILWLCYQLIGLREAEPVR